MVLFFIFESTDYKFIFNPNYHHILYNISKLAENIKSLELEKHIKLYICVFL